MRSRILTLIFVVVAAAFAGVHRVAAQPSLTEIADRMKSVNPTLRTFIVDQVADTRVLAIFRWRLNTTMYASRPASYKVIIHNPPPLIGRFFDVISDVSSPEQVLANYRGAAIRPGPNNRLILDLVGVSSSVNPPAIVATIDAAHWVAEDLLLKYSWGDVRVTYHYEMVSGYLLPVTMRVDIPRYTIAADVTFTNYRLNVPIPPGTFDSNR
jgi:hypothetical protein